MKVALAALVAALALPAVALADAPRVDASAYLVANGGTGEVLLQHEAGRRLPMASITKLMTALVVLDRARPGDVVTVAPVPAVGSTVHLRAGERHTVEDLLEAALVQSANDAARALAVHVGGTEARFVELMNARAQRLGLRDTRFANPHGLDAPGHYSTARDLTTLARVAMRNPVIRRIVAQETASMPGRTLHTWNDLLGEFPNLIGVKTGHTSAAGWSQVAAARGRGVTIYATILGGPTREARNADLRELLAYGLSQYRVLETVAAERVYARVATEYGRTPVPLVAARSHVNVVRVGRPLVERVVARAAVALPVRKGQRLGEVRVYDGRKLIASRPLVASRSIARPGFGGRAAWYAGRTARTIGSWLR